MRKPLRIRQAQPTRRKYGDTGSPGNRRLRDESIPGRFHGDAPEQNETKPVAADTAKAEPVDETAMANDSAKVATADTAKASADTASVAAAEEKAPTADSANAVTATATAQGADSLKAEAADTAKVATADKEKKAVAPKAPAEDYSMAAAGTEEKKKAKKEPLFKAGEFVFDINASFEIQAERFCGQAKTTRTATTSKNGGDARTSDLKPIRTTSTVASSSGCIRAT